MHSYPYTSEILNEVTKHENIEGIYILSLIYLQFKTSNFSYEFLLRNL